MTEDMPHILVVDDDTRLRELLRKYLSTTGFIVSVAKDAAEARTTLASLSFDLIVLDVMMPGESGLDLTAALRKTNDVPILLLTARGEPDDRIAGLEAGADDYLAKPFEARELVLRINSILRRVPRSLDPKPPLYLGRWCFAPERDELRDGDEILHLTTAEASLLRVLASSPGTAFTRDELTERLKINGNSRTVDVQVTRLRRKIEPDPSQPRYIQTVRGEGYLLRPD
ncbi:MAG: response regulator [Azospirillaceae bacterium]|nr:response regulator [Azospirillaceae bacterium]